MKKSVTIEIDLPPDACLETIRQEIITAAMYHHLKVRSDIKKFGKEQSARIREDPDFVDRTEKLRALHQEWHNRLSTAQVVEVK